MAGAVGNVVNSTGQATDKALGTYANSGADQINAGAAKIDPAVEARIKAGAGQTNQSQVDAINGGLKGGTYTSPTVTAAKYTGGTGTAAQYAGPADATGVDGRQSYQDLQTTLGGQLKQANAGQGGISSFLKGSGGQGGVFQQPSYTQGENGLDAFLTGASPDYQKNLSQVNSQWGSEGDKGSATDRNLNAQIARAKLSTGQVQSQYDQDAANAQNQTDQVNQGYQNLIGQNQVTAASNKAASDAAAKAASDAAAVKASSDAAAAKAALPKITTASITGGNPSNVNAVHASNPGSIAISGDSSNTYIDGPAPGPQSAAQIAANAAAPKPLASGAGNLAIQTQSSNENLGAGGAPAAPAPQAYPAVVKALTPDDVIGGTYGGGF